MKQGEKSSDEILAAMSSTDPEKTETLEAIGKLAGKIGHDFNNILASVQACSELMRSKLSKLYPENNPVEKQLRILDASVQKGTQLTTKIRGYVRPGPIEAETVDLVATVQHVTTLISSSGASPTDIEVTAHATPKILATEFIITQLLTSLCANALDALSGLEDRMLMIFVDTVDVQQGTHAGLAAGPYARLSVVDHGVGIAPQVMENIFQPFTSTKPSGVGSGFGLTMAMTGEIMKKLGGAIDLQSSSDRGTAVHLYFKIAP